MIAGARRRRQGMLLQPLGEGDEESFVGIFSGGLEMVLGTWCGMGKGDVAIIHVETEVRACAEPWSGPTFSCWIATPGWKTATSLVWFHSDSWPSDQRFCKRGFFMLACMCTSIV